VKGLRGVLEVGFSSCAVPAYCPMSKYFRFESQGSGFNAKECLTKGKGIVKGNAKGFGFGGLAFGQVSQGEQGFMCRF